MITPQPDTPLREPVGFKVGKPRAGTYSGRRVVHYDIRKGVSLLVPRASVTYYLDPATDANGGYPAGTVKIVVAKGDGRVTDTKFRDHYVKFHEQVWGPGSVPSVYDVHDYAVELLIHYTAEEANRNGRRRWVRGRPQPTGQANLGSPDRPGQPPRPASGPARSAQEAPMTTTPDHDVPDDLAATDPAMHRLLIMDLIPDVEVTIKVGDFTLTRQDLHQVTGVLEAWLPRNQGAVVRLSDVKWDEDRGVWMVPVPAEVVAQAMQNGGSYIENLDWTVPNRISVPVTIEIEFPS